MLLITIAIFLSMLKNIAFGHYYEKKTFNSHIVHILRLDPNKYEANIIKANNGNMGRETVSSMAKKSKASIAINGGFFEIGGQQDGQASGSLAINGRVYRIKKEKQPLIIIKNGLIAIEVGYSENHIKKDISLVSGIPLLLEKGKIPEGIFKQTSEFYMHPHARTALGIDSCEKVIIVLVEHLYTRDITAITMGELQSLMKEKGRTFAQKYNKQNLGEITLNELKQILRDEFTPQEGSTKGLTILELANLMLDLGCEYAINLDGGGSSTLWIDGHIINNSFGDKDEAAGEKIERPVSDAIIFKKK
jgi:exopolysaccharide biosynthesis protein